MYEERYFLLYQEISLEGWKDIGRVSPQVNNINIFVNIVPPISQVPTWIFHYDIFKFYRNFVEISLKNVLSNLLIVLFTTIVKSRR